MIIAEAQGLKRVRRERVQIMEQISLVAPVEDPNSQEAGSTHGLNRIRHHLDQLVRLERYECRALSRRRRAARIGGYFAHTPIKPAAITAEMPVSKFERRQLTAIRSELNHAHAERTARGS